MYDRHAAIRCAETVATLVVLSSARADDVQREGTVTVLVPPSAEYCLLLPSGTGNRDLRGVAASFPGSLCGEYQVSCPNIDNVKLYGLHVGPLGAVGTIVSVAGGRGGSFHTENAQEYVDAGFQVIMIANELINSSDASLCAKNGCLMYQNVNDPGPKQAGCRIATFVKYVNATYLGPTCAQGHSAGSSQLAYALAFHDLASVVPYVQLTGATPLARLDYGCNPTQGNSRSYWGTNPSGIRQNVFNRPYAYEDTSAAAATLAEDLAGLTDGKCSTGVPNTQDLQRLTAQSIDSPGAVWTYPSTVIDGYDCLSGESMVDGNGAWSWARVRDSNTGRAFFQGVVPGPAMECVGETVWWRGDGSPSPIRQLTIDRMIDLCM